MLFNRISGKMAIVAGLVLILLGGCGKAGREVESSSGLKYVDEVVGTGAEAVAGKLVKVNYTGMFEDGKVFDTSLQAGRQPLEFLLGGGQVIRGWEEGVAGMKVGGKRKLTIPPHLAYGEAGAGGVIPPNATLVFEIELLGVE